MLRALETIFDLLPFRVLFGGHVDRPIHFSSRARRRMNRARFASHLD